METDYVYATGLFDKPGCTQVNDARAKALSDCTPGSRVGNQSLAVALGQGKSGRICGKLIGKQETPFKINTRNNGPERWGPSVNERFLVWTNINRLTMTNRWNGLVHLSGPF